MTHGLLTWSEARGAGRELASPADSKRGAGARSGGAGGHLAHAGDATLSLLLERAACLREHIDGALAQIELTRVEFDTLKRLRHAGETMAGATGRSPRERAVLERLTLKGLARLESRGQDGSRFALTELGSARLSDGAAALAVIADQFVAGLSLFERVELRRLLDVLRNELRASDVRVAAL